LEETAYVEDGGIGSFGVRASYEAKGYKPAFDDLPPEETYKASRFFRTLPVRGEGL
jgi:hypothetical protein